MKQRSSSNSSNPGCGCLFLIIIVNLVFGSKAFAYCLDSFFAKDTSPIVDMIGGLFLGEIIIPLAIVCWILKVCGVETPFIY